MSKFTKRLCLLLVVFLSLPLMSLANPKDDFNNMPVETLKAQATAIHPAGIYILASKLFQSGAQDEAVFWFYVGQLRYRFYLMASPNLDPSGDPALFSSLQEMLGRPLNEYAFGDIPTLVKTIDRVLDWDKSSPNEFFSKTEHAAAWESTRSGLASMRDEVKASAAQIKEQRLRNGLSNRA